MADNDEEFLLDAPDTLPTDANAVIPVEQGSDDMAIDEEGRPRFAPAQDIVRIYKHVYKCMRNTSNFDVGPYFQSRDPKDSYPASPNDTFEAILALYLPTSR